jgi:DNA-binding LytR/AlgR family response regulator
MYPMIHIWLQKLTDIMTNIAINTLENVHIGAWKDVCPQEVMLLVADVNYTKIYFNDGKKMTVATSLKELQNRFNTPQFFRIHKSYLVNLHFVEEFNCDTIRMSNNVNVTLARRRKTAFKEVWRNEINA